MNATLSDRRQDLPVWLTPAVFASGAAGLVYETLWIRLLSLSLGSTAQALCLVLSLFMLGLGLGAWAFGRAADRSGRPLRLYAGLELGLALFCALTPGLFLAAGPASAVVLLLLPAMLLGGSMPALVRHLAGLGLEQGPAVSRLYFWNTLGAAAGAFSACFVLLPYAGVALSLRLAAAASAAAGFAALAASRSEAPAAEAWVPAESLAAQAPGDRIPAKALFALAGLCAMAFEVVWTRLFSIVLGASTYSLALVLTAHLAGLALGGLLAGPLLERRLPQNGTLGLLLAGAGAAWAGLLALYPWMPFVYLKLYAVLGEGALSLWAWNFAFAFAALLVPATLMGMTLPWFAKMADAGRLQGARVGGMLLSNTLGSAAGPWLATFLLIPALGLPGAAGALALSCALLGAVVMLLESPAWRLGAAGTAAAALAAWILAPAMDPAVLHSGAAANASTFLQAGKDMAAWKAFLHRRTPLYAEDGATASVSVWQYPGGGRSLNIDGKPDASDGTMDMPTQLLLGHLPLLIVPEAHSALVIGLGSGVTLAAAARHPVGRIDVVEIEPRVVEASGQFGDVNRGVLGDPRVRLTLDDGRRFLRRSEVRYDAIISQPSNPWLAGVSHLFTREFYGLARERLSPGGAFCQWLPAYGLPAEALRVELETFRQAFPHASVWSSGLNILLVGTLEPQRLGWERLEAALARAGVKEDLDRYVLGSAPELLAHWVTDEEGLARLASDRWTVRVNSDDRPVLEFLSPLGTHERNSGRRNVALLEAFAQPVAKALAGGEGQRRWLARSLLVLERSEAAARVIEALPKDEPWLAGLRRDLADTYLKQGQARLAAELFELRLRERPRDPAAHLDLARARMAEGDEGGALKALEGFSRVAAGGKAGSAAAKALKEGRPEYLYLAMGYGYARLNEGRRAADAFAKVIKTAPELLNGGKDESELVR